ncbi:fatty acyl-CoA synthetase [Alicyclobacillus sp. ALC3]|uniref:fatty acyl-CoA synthetase n=1 Tax=Alicyclobacillus sp. ALC3 TaxID=2796143 RepID=UPI0023780A50|nr:fatty acyl-CoA synthetase [Alicyclobacillus sp. ALC3]WDL99244.1 long-chain-fatty-acid--CoA ligase [Alicyclobacillus sp. ALC3]
MSQESRDELSGTVSRARRNTLSDLLSRSAARYSGRRALVFQDEAITYAEFEARVCQVSRLFAEDGLGHGSRIAILSRNSLDFVVAAFATARIGSTLVPINYMLTVDDVAYITHHAKVNALLAPLDLAPQLEEGFMRESGAANTAAETSRSDAPRYLLQTEEAAAVLSSMWKPLRSAHALSDQPFDSAVAGTDVAQILYTSGTESRPKGVMLTHDNLIAEYVSCIVDGEMESRDVAVHALPLYHSAQLNCFLGPSVYLGGTGIILEQAAPSAILETIETHGVTQLFCPPTVWIALLRHPDFEKRDLTSLRKCYYGAAIMPMEVLKELMTKLPQAEFWNFYGQTEVAPLATVLKPEDQLRKLGSAGLPALNVETRIVDDNGDEVAPGEVGEIVHRTAHAMLGYLDDPERTEQAFSDGWFHSGDLGVRDEEGYITVIDRKKDMIKTGGINVASREVEEAIYQYPGVSEVAVIGVPDSYWIEAVTAVVVAKPGVTLTPDELEVHCRDVLAKFKVPKHIVIADTLPRNPSGKILKRDLREAYKGLA